MPPRRSAEPGRGGRAGRPRRLVPDPGRRHHPVMRDADRNASIDAHLARPWAERQRPPPRVCAWPGCSAEGLYRAPRSRERLRDYCWLCLEHVREHNRRWDYFAGMSPAEIDRHRRLDATWHRPSWRFGVGPGRCGLDDPFEDPLGILRGRRAPPRPREVEPEAVRMMRRLGLEPGFTLDELKRRFKLLAKRLHPDLNGADRAAEARLREVIEAYRYLLDRRLYAGGPAAP